MAEAKDRGAETGDGGRLSLEGKLRMYESWEAMMNRIHPEVCDVIDLETFLKATVEEMGKSMGVDRCDLMILSGEEPLRIGHEYRATRKVPSSLNLSLSLRASDLESLFQRDERGRLLPLPIADASSPVVHYGLRDVAERLGTASILIAPISFRGKLMGIMGLHHCRRPHQWAPEEVNFAHSLAQQISIAFQYTRLFTEKENEVRVIRTLLDIANEINTRLDAAGVVSFIIDKSVGLLQADFGCIGMVDLREEYLSFEHFQTGAGRVENFLRMNAVKIGDHEALVRLLKERSTLCIDNVKWGGPAASSLSKVFRGNAMLISPIVVGDKPLGTLTLLWHSRRPPFTPYELDLVKGICNQTAIVLEKLQLTSEVLRLRKELKGESSQEIIVGNSRKMQRCMEMALYVADKSTTVLLQGESGTGKELLADFIQRNSKRLDGPFVKINCGALPESILESELFGHEQGAFTDARYTRIGKFEEANGGTLFLDEVSEMVPSAQVKLLRVLQNGELTRVGGNEIIRTDVRVIAATNADMETAVKGGRFRLDLYYRLNVYPIVLPPLREREDDLPLLVNIFFEKFKKKVGKYLVGISEDAMKLLQLYHWPGNVRELENVMERAVIVAEGNIITEEDLPDSIRDLAKSKPALGVNGDGDADAGPLHLTPGLSMEEVERNLIFETLKSTGGDKTKAAKILGIGRKTLYRKLERYG